MKNFFYLLAGLCNQIFIRFLRLFDFRRIKLKIVRIQIYPVIFYQFYMIRFKDCIGWQQDNPPLIKRVPLDPVTDPLP
jgi:hypothetical protein